MNIDIDNLKKRILYRSQYRGTREMDKLLYSFVLKNINKINKPLDASVANEWTLVKIPDLTKNVPNTLNEKQKIDKNIIHLLSKYSPFAINKE